MTNLGFRLIMTTLGLCTWMGGGDDDYYYYYYYYYY